MRLKQEEGTRHKTGRGETETGRGNKTIISETETGRGEQDNRQRDHDRKTGTRQSSARLTQDEGTRQLPAD